MWVPFQNRTIHIGTWISFVGITDYIFDIGGITGRETPLDSSWKTSATPPAKTTFFDLFDQPLRCHLGKTFPQGLVATRGNIRVNVFRIDESTVTSRNPQLLLFRHQHTLHLKSLWSALKETQLAKFLKYFKRFSDYFNLL